MSAECTQESLTPQCSNCRFYSPKRYEVLEVLWPGGCVITSKVSLPSNCHRYPIFVLDRKPNDWCGEHEEWNG